MTLIELLEYVKTAGGLVAPVFAVLFWLERDERKDAQRELKEITLNSVEAMTELKATIHQLLEIFAARTQQRR